MRKPIFLALIAFIAVVLIALFFLSGKTPLSDIGNQFNPDKGSHEADSGDLSKDEFQKDEAVRTLNISTCGLINDSALRKECASDVNEEITSLGGGGSGEKGSGGGAGKEGVSQNDEIFNDSVVVYSTYKCGSDLCFQLKALDGNLEDFSIENASYSKNGAEVFAVGWDGDVSGSSCVDTKSIEPGQTCFGKVPNTDCLSGDFFGFSLPTGAGSSKEIGECA